MCSKTGAACTGRAQVQTRWGPSDEIGSQTQALTPKNLTVIGTQLQRKKLVSSGIIWGIFTHKVRLHGHQ